MGVWRAPVCRPHPVRPHAILSDRERSPDGDWECVATLEGHDSEVKCCAWSPTAAWLASCGRDKSVWVWEATPEGDFECAAVLTGHAADVKWLAWRPGGADLLTSASYDESLRLWAPADSAAPSGEDWELVQALPGVAAVTREAMKRLAHGGAADGSLEAAARLEGEEVGGHADTVWGAAWRPDGACLASCGGDGELRVWRATAGPTCTVRPDARRSEAHGGREAFSVAWSKPVFEPDVGGESLLASAGGDNALRVWRHTPQTDMNSGKLGSLELVAEAVEAHPGSDVNCVAWSPVQAGWLATAGDDGCVCIWALESAPLGGQGK